MTQKDEWTDWIEHDGKGCPCRGEYVQMVHEKLGLGFVTYECIAGSVGERKARSWDWSNFPNFSRIIRYRIRKPRGMAVLESILADMPEAIHSKEDV